MDKNTHDMLEKKLLMQILYQLPKNSILAFPKPSYFDDCKASKLLEKFRIQDSFSKDIIIPDYYYLIGDKSRSTYIEQIANTDLLTYLCHFMIYSKCDQKIIISVMVYDNCVFCLSDEIIIEQEFMEQCEDAGLHIQKL